MYDGGEEGWFGCRWRDDFHLTKFCSAASDRLFDAPHLSFRTTQYQLYENVVFCKYFVKSIFSNLVCVAHFVQLIFFISTTSLANKII